MKKSLFFIFLESCFDHDAYSESLVVFSCFPEATIYFPPIFPLFFFLFLSSC